MQRSFTAENLNPFLTVTQRGDYVAAGVGMRGTGAGEIILAEIPENARVTHAFLYWTIVDTALDDSFDDGMISGVPISGVLIGTDVDPCWDVFGASQSFAFRADVTSLVPGNGTYELTDFATGPPTPTSSFGEAITLPLLEGASLVVLYEDPAALENRDIVIYEGAVTLRGSKIVGATTMTIPPVGTLGSAKTTFVVADGQDHGTDKTLFNGQVLAEDIASTSSSFDASDGLLWDTDTYDVTNSITPGDQSVVAEITKGTDCLVHVAQIFSASSSEPLPELSCEVEIISPEKGAFICPDSVEVQLAARISGGFQPVVTSECFVNGVMAQAINDTVFSATIPLVEGLNQIEATCTFTDQAGSQTTCSDSAVVLRAFLPSCEVTIDSPMDSAVVCADSLQVTGFIGLTSGVDPVEIVCEVNGVEASVFDSTFSATIPLEAGDNVIIATCTVTDSCGNVSVCRDTVVVLGPPEPICTVEITSPKDSSFVCGDSVTVAGVTTIEGGLGPFEIQCFVNGVIATVSEGGEFEATISGEQALTEGITATCIVTDSCGSKVLCFDAITVAAPPELVCNVEIISPEDGFSVCGDSLEVSGVTSVEGGIGPFDILCEVNGFATTVDDEGGFTVTIPVDTGGSIVATCVVTDSCGTETVCTDSVTIVAPPAPVCTVDIQSPKERETFCGDSLEVSGRTLIEGGLQPFSITCDVNDVETEVGADGSFMATIPLELGVENTIIATCIVVDSCGAETVCADTITVLPPAAPVCNVEILSPADSSTFCGDSLKVSGLTLIEGGTAPFEITCDVNGFAAEVDASGGFMATIPLDASSENAIIATCTITDSCGTSTVCADTIVVFPPTPPVCTVEITSPEDSSTFCGNDSLKVTGLTTVEGGVGSVSIQCEVNGVETTVSADGTFMATVPLELGVLNTIVATCVVVDSCGTKTVCTDSIVVQPPAPPVCTLEITSPQEGASVCGDSVEVSGTTLVEGEFPPFVVTCSVNGVDAIVSEDGSFVATVALSAGENSIVATCTVTDSCGSQTVCEDSVTVIGPTPPICEITFPALQDSAVVCEETLQVQALTSISGGLPPFDVTCDINGVPTEVVDKTFSASLSLESGANVIVATCTIVDSCGVTTTCSDSITVFLDDTPPECAFQPDGLSVAGVFTDDLSGIAEIVPKRLRNGLLTLDPDPFFGARLVKFRIDPIDPTQTIGFVIDLVDSCGNTFRCDPVYLGLVADRPQRQFNFTFPEIDRYFRLDNDGLTEVRVDLNGNKFSLHSDPGRAAVEVNAFVMPHRGAITIDLEKYLNEGENNMSLTFEGPAGSSANLLLVDIIDRVDFVLELQTLPTEFSLAQNYPNPFNPTTRIHFEIPAGVEDPRVQLRVFNLLGELVRVLVDQQKAPGEYFVEWDGRDETGRAVSTGIYVYQLVAGEFRQTKRMLLLK